MPKQKIIITIAVILVIVGGIGSLFTFKSVFATSEDTTIKETFPVEMVQNINLESDNAGIEVISTTDSEVSVEFTAPEKKQKRYEFNTEVADETLTIVAKEKRRFSLFSLDFSFSNPKIKVLLPEQQYEEILVDVVNGKVDIHSLQITNVAVETVNGAINIDNMETTTSRVKSQNGRLNLSHLQGEITGKVTNGSINLEAEYLDQSIDLTSVNGKITVQTEHEPTNATIDTDVTNGKVNMFGNNDHHATFGEGENKINLSTVNGSITISK